MQEVAHDPSAKFFWYQYTITSTHTSTSAAKKYIQPYIHKVFVWTKQNNLLLNPDKTTCTLFTPNPAENTSNLDLTINNKALPMATHYLDRFWTSVPLEPKTHIQHTHPQHLCTTSTNHKSTHCNRMGSTEGDTHGYL